MIDGLCKSRVDAVWDRLAWVLVWLGLTPNQVTMGGLVLVFFACAHFAVYQSSLWFGILLALALSGDSLDGAVARLTQSSSRYGAYLDAVVDRYQEVLILGAIAAVRGCWAVSFLAITGSMLVSYNKARVAIEIPISNLGWPDLLERTERVVILVITLVADGLVPGRDVLWWGVAGLAALSHATAVQRFLRARRLLLKDGESGRRAPPAASG